MKRTPLSGWTLALTAIVCLAAAAGDAQAQGWGGIFGGGGNGGGWGGGGSGWGGGWGNQRGSRSHGSEWGEGEWGEGGYDPTPDIINGLGRIIDGWDDNYYPRNPRPNYRPYRPAPRNVTRPAIVATPKNAAPAKVSLRSNNPLQAFSSKKAAGEQTKEGFNEVRDTAADELIVLGTGVPGGQLAGAAAKLKAGDPTALEGLLAMPGALTPDEAQLAKVAIDAHKAGENAGNGLNSTGNEAAINSLGPEIAKLPPGLQGKFTGPLGNVTASNNTQKVVELIGDLPPGGGGLSNGTLFNAGIDTATLDGPFYLDEPVEDEDAASSFAGKVVLSNPDENGESVSYVLEGVSQSYSLEPGYSQKLSKSYTVRFDPGSGKEKRYKCVPGSYEFIVTEKGWDLKKKTYEVTIDNSDYPGEFNYVADNKQYSLEEGETKTHESGYPIVVRFDRGDGDEAVKELRGGEYLVGIDLNEGRLDLFEDDGRDSSRVSRAVDDRSSSRRGGKLQAKAASEDDLFERLQDLSPAERRALKKLLDE